MFGQGQDVIMNMWMRSAASGSLTAALNITELNGNGRLQLAYTPEKRLSLWAHTRLLWYRLPLTVKKNLKQFKYFREIWQPCMHWSTYKGTHISFLWTGEANRTFLHPCPLCRETKRNSGQLRKRRSNPVPLHDEATSLSPLATLTISHALKRDKKIKYQERKNVYNLI